MEKERIKDNVFFQPKIRAEYGMWGLDFQRFHNILWSTNETAMAIRIPDNLINERGIVFTFASYLKECYIFLKPLIVEEKMSEGEENKLTNIVTKAKLQLILDVKKDISLYIDEQFKVPRPDILAMKIHISSMLDQRMNRIEQEENIIDLKKRIDRFFDNVDEYLRSWYFSKKLSISEKLPYHTIAQLDNMHANLQEIKQQVLGIPTKEKFKISRGFSSLVS